MRSRPARTLRTRSWWRARSKRLALRCRIEERAAFELQPVLALAHGVFALAERIAQQQCQVRTRQLDEEPLALIVAVRVREMALHGVRKRQ